MSFSFAHAFEGVVEFNSFGLRILDEHRLRGELSSRLLEEGLRAEAPAQRALAVLTRQICAAACILPAVLPSVDGPTPLLDFGDISFSEALALAKAYEKNGLCPPAFADRKQGADALALKAYSLALEGLLRGPIFLCVAAPCEEIGILNLLPVSAIAAQKSLSLPYWERTKILRATSPGLKA